MHGCCVSRSQAPCCLTQRTQRCFLTEERGATAADELLGLSVAVFLRALLLLGGFLSFLLLLTEAGRALPLFEGMLGRGTLLSVEDAEGGIDGLGAIGA